MGLGEFLSLASAAVWAVAIILFKGSGESFSATGLNLFKNLLATALLVPTVLLFAGATPPPFTTGEWLTLAASGLIGISIADTLYLQALRTMGASRTGIAATLYSPSVVLLSYLFLGERLTAIQLVGFGLVLTALVLITYRTDRRELSPEALRLGMTVGIAGVAFMASAVVLVKPILERGPFLWIVLTRVAAGVAGQLLIAAARGRLKRLRDEFRGRHQWFRLCVASTLGTYVAMMMWLGGYRYTDASVAAVLNETAAIFIVLLAWRYLGEPLQGRKLVGVGLSFLGVVLMVSG